MNNHIPVLFYDGNRSSPSEVRMELQHHAMYLFALESHTDNALVFLLSKCSVSYFEDKLLVYLYGGGGPCIEINATHPQYAELTTLLKQSSRGWFQKLLKQKWQLLLLLLVGLLVLLYLLMVQFIPFAGLKLISTKQEVVLGEKIYRTILSTSKVDAGATDQLQKFANELQLSSSYPIQVTVVDNEEVNAFALPGGHIVVYTGILNVIEQPEALVALLGHEATHINHRHSLKGMLSGLSLAIMQSIVLSGFGSVGDMVLRNASSLQQLSYSRKLEREADKEGMELMLQNKVNPVGMKLLMQQLQDSDKGLPSSFSFISSHPLSEERINNANAFILQHKSTNFGVNTSLQTIWEALKDTK